MLNGRRFAAIVALSVAFAVTPTVAVAQDAAQDVLLTEEGIISGTMEVDFKTRTDVDMDGVLLPGSARPSVQDVFKFTLIAAKTTQYSGVIKRRPELFRADGFEKVQQGYMTFAVRLRVRNSRNLNEGKDIGNWVGIAPFVSATGAYDLAGDRQSPLRIGVDLDVGRLAAYREAFTGNLSVKIKKADRFASQTYTRRFVDRVVARKVESVDAVWFEKIELARGSALGHPHATVDGRLDYDVKTGDWLTGGVKFAYKAGDRDVEDVMTGSVKWVEDGNRLSTGKGFYTFNLRFNEAQHRPAGVPDALSDEEAFFAVDDSIPCLTGTIEFVDEFIPGTSRPAKSKISYALNANKLTKAQVLNFFHLWLLATAAIHNE